MKRIKNLIIVEQRDLLTDSYNVALDVVDLALDFYNETGNTSVIVAAYEPWHSSWTVAIESELKIQGLILTEFRLL